MTEELEQLLKNLRLRRILEIYKEQLRAADKSDISYSEFVTRLVRAQWQANQEGAREWRIRRANLPERWTLKTFPFARQPGLNREQIRGFAELELIANAGSITSCRDCISATTVSIARPSKRRGRWNSTDRKRAALRRRSAGFQRRVRNSKTVPRNPAAWRFHR
jgi:hypothetical protein